MIARRSLPLLIALLFPLASVFGQGASVTVDANGNVLNSKPTNFPTGKLKVNGVVLTPGGVSGTSLTSGDVIAGAGGSNIQDGGFAVSDIARLSVADIFTNLATQATPAAGKSVFWFDTTAKNIFTKNDAGTVNHGVQTQIGAAKKAIASIADDGSSSLHQFASNELADFSPTAPTSSGKIPIWDQSAAQYIPGDPLVQGLLPDGSTTAGNPVAIGGYDTAGTPALHRAIELNSNPAGTEYGLVTRNIPSGTQPVSGTVTANAGSGTFNIQSNASVNETQLAGTAIDVNSGNKSAGTQRFVIATDQPQLTNALKVDGSAVTQPVSGTVTSNAGTGTFNIQSNASVNETQIAGTAIDVNSGVKSAGTQRFVLATDQPQLTNALKVDGSAVTQPVSIGSTVTVAGGKTNNNAAPGSTNIGALPAISTASAPGYTEGNQVALSVDNSGALRTTASAAAVNDVTATGDLVATGSVTTSTLNGSSSVGVYIFGTWVATVQFEGTIDGTNYFAAYATPINGSAPAFSTTTNGQWQIDSGAYANVRARVSSYTSGTVSIRLRSSTGLGTINLASLPTGSNNIGSVSQASFPWTTSDGHTTAGAPLSLRLSDGSAFYNAPTSAQLPTALDGSGSLKTHEQGTAATNETQLAGTAIDVNSGNKSAGTQRFVLATDQPQLTNALKVDGSAVTQPVSGTVTANAGTGTFNIQSNASMNETQIAGTAIDVNSGVKSAGTQRFVLATDQPQLTNALKVDGSAVTQPVSGTVTTSPPSNASSNITQLAGTVIDVNSGNKSAGTQRFVLATDQPALSTPLPIAQNAATSTSLTLQSSAVANGNGTVLTVDGQSAAALTVNCSVCSGGTTVNFEVSEDGTNFSSQWGVQAGTNTVASSTTTSGITIWEIPVGSFKQLRARISGYSAGTITVTGHAAPIGYAPKVVNANIVSSTNISVNQGTAASSSAGWPVKNTDGTNVAAVKAASTAAGATDPALVVAISPNNTLPENQTQIGGTTIDTNSGNKSAGTQRVVLATDQPTMTNAQPVTPQATESFLGFVGGKATIVSANFTRPADTTAYASGDLVANSTTAGSVTPLSFTVSRLNDGSGMIRRVILKKSGTTTTNGSFRLHLYRSDPSASTGIANGDNGAWSTNFSNWLGDVDLDMTSTTNGRAFRDSASAENVPAVGTELNFIPNAGTQTVYGLLEARAAYTPGSAEVFTVYLEVLQN